MKLTTYLTFNGNCAEAFQHYEKALGGKIVVMQKHGETPMADQVPRDWKDAIMHARLVIGDAVLMGSDMPPGKRAEHSGFSVSAHVDTAEEAERVFAALSEGGSVNMPLQETFWATRFGMLTDKYGVDWMVNVEKPA